jgi:hypothetical protein
LTDRSTAVTLAAMGTRLGRRFTRRALIVGAAASGASVLVPRPSWLGAIVGAAPADPVIDVLAAYVSTLVPGPVDDPEGTAGAVEAGAVQQLQVHVPYVIPLLVADVEAAALAEHGQPFTALGYADREALLVAAFADAARAPYHLVALAIGAGSFYADFVNRVGGTHLGFPGPSNGYLDTYTDRTGHGQPQALAIPA